MIELQNKINQDQDNSYTVVFEISSSTVSVVKAAAPVADLRSPFSLLPTTESTLVIAAAV